MKIRLAAFLAGLGCCAWGAALAADVVSFKVLKLEGNSVRWRTHEQGQRLVISYGLIRAATEFSGARNCRKMTSLEGLLEASTIEAAAVHEEIAAAFAMWQSVSDITFREAPSPEEADILIGAQVDPEGWAFADVFYDASRSEPVKPISKALICLNPEKRWKIGFDGDFKIYDLRYTIAHEIGHAIGLDHPSGAGQIMGYRYEERFRALQPGDVAGAVLLYGARQPDTAIAAAEPRARTVQRYAASRRFAKRWGSRAFTARSH